MNSKVEKNKILIGIVVIVAIVVVAVLILENQKEANNPTRLLELGQKYLEEQNYEQAIVCFEQVLEIEPKNVEVYLQLADAYVAMGEPEKAIEVLKQGLTQVESEELRQALEKLEAEIEEKDPRFEACVVDGIYHNGYEYYDLTDEETAFLAKMIELMQSGQNEAVFNLFEEEREIISDLVKKYGNNDMSEGTHIAFEKYKVYISHYSGREQCEISVIPIEFGKGYWYDTWSSNDLIYKSYSYAIAECNNGMFEGEFERHTSNWEGDTAYIVHSENGTLKNGLLNGMLIGHRQDPKGDWEQSYQEEYINGKPQNWRKNKEGWLCIGYEIDEEGNAIYDDYMGEYRWAEQFTGIEANEEFIEMSYWSIHEGNMYKSEMSNAESTFWHIYPW